MAHPPQGAGLTRLGSVRCEDHPPRLPAAEIQARYRTAEVVALRQQPIALRQVADLADRQHWSYLDVERWKDMEMAEPTTAGAGFLPGDLGRCFPRRNAPATTGSLPEPWS